MFSITGDLLSGSTIRPDFMTIITIEQNANTTQSRSDSYPLRRLDRLGKIPLVSTITGFGRALIGLVHLIGHLACAIFDQKNRDAHLDEVKLGASNIGVGVLEMIPLVGNLGSICIQARREQMYEKISFQEVQTSIHAFKPKYVNTAVLLINGKESSCRPLDEYNQALKKFDKPTSEDKERIIVNNPFIYISRV